MLPSPIAPDECPWCARGFASRDSLDSHLRLDHVVDEHGSLTVADILAAPGEKPPAVPHRSIVAQPWVVAALAAVVLLYALTHAGFGVGRLVLVWVLSVVVGAALAFAAWRRAERSRGEMPPSH